MTERGSLTVLGRPCATLLASQRPAEDKVKRSPPRPRIVAALCVLAALAGFPASAQEAMDAHPQAESEPEAVSSYCARFARAYAATHRVDLAGEVRVRKAPAIMRRLSNVFQPAGSRFVSGYRCRFATAASGGEHRSVSVGLYVAETREFAEYTQWKGLQTIPIARVEDERNGRTGYGVFKYLRED